MKTVCVILAVVCVTSSSNLGRTDWETANDLVNEDWISAVEHANEQVRTSFEQIDIVQEIALSLLSNRSSDLGVLERQLIRARNDVNIIVQLLNQASSVRILVVDNTGNTVKIDSQGIQSIVLQTSRIALRRTNPGGLLDVFTVAQIMKEICDIIVKLRPTLEASGIPANSIQLLLNSRVESRKGLPNIGDIIVGIVKDLIRIQLRKVLTPVRQHITVTLTELTNQILTLYIPVAPENPILAAVGGVVNIGVIRVVQVLVNVNYTCNVIFDNILGTKEVAVVVDGREVIVQEPEEQKKNITIITKPLNKIAKKIVKKAIESRYETVGKSILTPIELAIDWSIDQLLPTGK